MQRLSSANSWAPTTPPIQRMMRWQRVCFIALAFDLLISCGGNEGTSTVPRETAIPARDAALSSPSPAPPDAAVPTAVVKAPGLAVTLGQTRNLQLIEWIWKRGKPGIVGLEGTLVARVTNTGDIPVTIKRLEVHGLLFSDTERGIEYSIINPSQCMRDFALPSDPTIQLAPGQVYEYVIDSWGSAGTMWKAPPPGTYRVVYRALPGNEESREVPKDPGSIAVLENCEQTLHSQEYWSRAAVSEPLEVSLEAPIKKKIEP